MGLSHQVIQGHVPVHGHVAPLERKDLPPGRRVRERHIDDPIEATWSHQSLEGGDRAQVGESGGGTTILPFDPFDRAFCFLFKMPKTQC